MDQSVLLAKHLRAAHRRVSAAQLAALAGDREFALKAAADARLLIDLALEAMKVLDYAQAAERNLVVIERAEFLERLVSETEPRFSSELDTREHAAE